MIDGFRRGGPVLYKRGIRVVGVVLSLTLTMAAPCSAAQAAPQYEGGLAARASSVVTSAARLTQSAALQSPLGNNGAMFGQAVAVSGQTAVVVRAFGAAYVYQRTQAGWAHPRLVARLTARTGSGGLFSRVAISGSTIVIGDPYRHVDNKVAQGAAYVFVRPPGGWHNIHQTAQLTLGGSQDHFGAAVAVSGQTIVVSRQPSGADSPAAYVYTRPASGWAHATAPAGLSSPGSAQFGLSVAVAGRTVAVGNASATRQYGVDIFTRPASGWGNATPTAVLRGKSTSRNDELGAKVAIDNQTVVAGARQPGVRPRDARSVLYAYDKPEAGWHNATPSAVLRGSDSGEANDLGASVAISGNTIVAGAPQHSTNTVVEPGGVYRFVRPAHGWRDATQTQEIIARNPVAHAAFGFSVAISTSTMVVGAPATGSQSPGSAFIFTPRAEATVQQGWTSATGSGLFYRLARGSRPSHPGKDLRTIWAGRPRACSDDGGTPGE
jgi:hypothetical protein